MCQHCDERTVDAIRAAGIPVDGWERVEVEEDTSPLLVITTPLRAELGPRETYTRIQAVLAERMTPLSEIQARST